VALPATKGNIINYQLDYSKLSGNDTQNFQGSEALKEGDKVQIIPTARKTVYSLSEGHTGNRKLTITLSNL
jgi:hypothetical protein